MFKNISKFILLLVTSFAFAQTGHLMQGVGAINMSMGGAATAQPLDISGAMQWNPAALSVFDGSRLKLDIGMFKGTPTLYSSLPAGAMWPEDAFGPGSPASPPVKGSTESELGYNPMPALAFAWGKANSKHTFGISAFGVSGFGVDFPQETNLPINADNSPNPNWKPNDSNPILYPQSLKGFGHLESAYMLMQIGFTWAYEISDQFSIGIQPTFNYEALDLSPNPLASPNATGYPTKESASSIGFGGQIGMFYDSQKGFKLGVSYKTSQKFSEMDFGNGTKFQMDYPAVYSVGLGYSKGIIDFALDYRYVDYKGAEGFEKTGWTPTASIKGFGWESISVVSTGLQLKAIKKLPLRFGYTYSTNPINKELTFFSTPATAIIAHAFQFGFSYEFSDAFIFDAVYHHGISDGKTSGNLFNPQSITPSHPLGKISSSVVAYDMNTHMFMIGLQFKLGVKDTDGDGVKDKDDACPKIAGLKQLNGCPDLDSDGVQDSEDACPDIPGLAQFNGCPDTDNDGVADKDDACPNEVGTLVNKGCPDADDDGIVDKDDACIDEAGVAENKGCPWPDKDGDGIIDRDDYCPNVIGVAANRGCPEVTEEVQEEINLLAKQVFFNTGKTTFTDETLIRLDAVSKILSKYTALKFEVGGHTDSIGSKKVNEKLSQTRAEAVMNFLISKGFPAENIKAIGYGSSNPIGDNNTDEGRQQNRRVEVVYLK